MSIYSRDFYGGISLEVAIGDGCCIVKSIDWFLFNNVEDYQIPVVFSGTYAQCVAFVDNAFAQHLEDRLQTGDTVFFLITRLVDG